MEFSLVGILIFLVSFVPQILLTIFPPKIKMIKKKNKQIEIIDFICRCGLWFFSIFNLFSYGYRFINNVTQIIWVIGFFLISFLIFCLYLRYFMKGRCENDLFDRIIIPYPIGFLECLLFLFRGAILLNYYDMFFSIVYFFTHMYLGIKR